ncbi:MAG: TRL-like family protein [Leptospiraceae bacterium]|nr:TRL-like family protein [Leptospiraceae bacterium]MCP5497394.1 TRL-like family protein [Leptospiraceae bacterium]
MIKDIVNLFIFCFLLVNCTGLNIGQIYRTPSTSPTPDYTNPVSMEYRGGWIYHNNTVSGQIGHGATTRLRGQSCSHSVLWLVSWGDSSIEAAKLDGGISKVAATEFNQMGIVSAVYHRFCTIVIGD